MTHLWKDSERQDIGTPSIWLWGRYLAPLVHDLLETMNMFRSQTADPALKALGCMAAMLFKTFCLAWREALGHARVQYHLNLRDGAPLSKEMSGRPPGLSIDSTVNLRKIQGALGENWSAAATSAPRTQPVRAHQGQANRWSDAKRVDAGKVVENPWHGSLGLGRGAASQAPAAHEEILGLDDIFDRPVTGLLMDSVQTAPMCKPRKKAGASSQRALPDYAYDDTDALYTETKKEAMAYDAAAPQQSRIGRRHYAAVQANARPVPVQASAKGSGYSMENTADWYSMTEGGDALPEGLDVASPVEDYEPHFDNFDEVIAGGGDLPIGVTFGLADNAPVPAVTSVNPEPTRKRRWEIRRSLRPEARQPDPAPALQTPTAVNPVQPEPVNESKIPAAPQPVAHTEPPPSAVKMPEPVAQAQTVPVITEASEPIPQAPVANSAPPLGNPIPWYLQAVQKLESHYRQDSQGSQETVKPSSVPPQTELQPPAQPSLAKSPEAPKPAEKSEKSAVSSTSYGPLNLDHELEDDLSSCDYMVQSNRILSNSITNLVDRYFLQASQEEEPFY